MTFTDFKKELLSLTENFVSDVEYYCIVDDKEYDFFESLVDFISCLLSSLLLVCDPSERGEIVGMLESVNGLESPFDYR